MADIKIFMIYTFAHRGTEFNDIVAFEEDFTEDIVRQNRWKAFVKKKRALENVSFKDTIALVKDVLGPIIGAIQSGAQFDMKWVCEDRRWK